MELDQAIRQRKSVRKFVDQDIPTQDLEDILEAARWAPSGKNIQNWFFVVIKNKSLIEKIRQAIVDKNEQLAQALDRKEPGAGDAFRKGCKGYTLFSTNAPVLTVVYGSLYEPTGYREFAQLYPDSPLLTDLQKARNPGMQGVGAAIQNFCLKATELGYGTCWLTSPNYAAPEIEALLSQEAGFEKENYFMAAFIALGKPLTEPSRTPRKPLEEISFIIE